MSLYGSYSEETKKNQTKSVLIIVFLIRYNWKLLLISGVSQCVSIVFVNEDHSLYKTNITYLVSTANNLT